MNDHPEMGGARRQIVAKLVTAYVTGNHILAQNLGDFIVHIGAAVKKLETVQLSGNGDKKVKPAVSVRKSLANSNFILSLIDGRPYRTLKRHLAKHGLTPVQYRLNYGLAPDYPMVAADYRLKRAVLAKKMGLGREKGVKLSSSGKLIPAQDENSGVQQRAGPAARSTQRHATR